MVIYLDNDYVSSKKVIIMTTQLDMLHNYQNGTKQKYSKQIQRVDSCLAHNNNCNSFTYLLILAH